MFLALFAAAALSPANAYVGPLALAGKGMAQCYVPNVATKTCASMATYHLNADGTFTNKAMVLIAKLATPKEEDRKAIEDQLKSLARELVDLEVLSLEHRVEVLDRELSSAREELAKARDGVDRNAKERYDEFLEKAKKKKQ